MIKKIKTDKLTPGMFIHDFNCSWLDHPFVGKSAKVRDEKIIDKIYECGIEELYIDTDKGIDIADAPTESEAREEIHNEVNAVSEDKEKSDNEFPISEELVRAKVIKEEAGRVIHDIMDDVRFGKQIRTEKVEPVVEKIIASIYRNQDALISLGRIKKVHEYTYLHSLSVCALMVSFCRYLGYDSDRLKKAGLGAILHDVGKMKVPAEILSYSGSLSKEDFMKMKEHVVYSHAILEEAGGIPRESILIAAQHHERVDGTGYPNKLKGDDISELGQAASIVDVYDAMTSKRAYQRKFEPTDVLGRLYEWSDKMFNRELVQKFIFCIGIYPVGTLVSLESGHLAVVIDHGKHGLLKPSVRVIFDINKGEYVEPYIIDLGDNEFEDREKIESYEVPERWNIRPEVYLK